VATIKITGKVEDDLLHDIRARIDAGSINTVNERGEPRSRVSIYTTSGSSKLNIVILDGSEDEDAIASSVRDTVNQAKAANTKAKQGEK